MEKDRAFKSAVELAAYNKGFEDGKRDGEPELVAPWKESIFVPRIHSRMKIEVIKDQIDVRFNGVININPLECNRLDVHISLWTPDMDRRSY